jgi:hypothetical protein
VPARTIFEKLGYTIDWDGTTGTVTATKDADKIIMQIGNDTMTVNGKKVKSDVAPQIHDGRTMVPLKFIADNTPKTFVTWDNQTQTANFITGDTAKPLELEQDYLTKKMQIADSNFNKLDKDQQQQVMEIRVPRSNGLLHVLGRNINGECSLLNEDINGKTLLANLHTIANQELAPEFEKMGITRDQLLDSIMTEAGDPGKINQDQHGTCAATSLQYLLCDENPAEYVRLMSGLLSPEGKATMRNGPVLVRDANSIAPDNSINRSVSERIFQAAMMEYCNGDLNYDNSSDIDKGLRPAEIIRGAQALFKQLYEPYTGDKPGILGSLIEISAFNGLEKYVKDDKQDIVDKLMERSSFNTLAGIDLGEPHMVVVKRVENGRVYYRNPWGPTYLRGNADNMPPLVIENELTGEESMDIHTFKKIVKFIIIPADRGPFIA